MLDTVVYTLVLFFVSALFLALPLYPWVKLMNMLKKRHYETWRGLGKPNLAAVLSFPAVRESVLDFALKIDNMPQWREKDPEVFKYARLCREIWLLLPRSFGKQVFIGFILLFIIGNFAGKIYSLLDFSA